jgi:hypothetical protein
VVTGVLQIQNQATGQTNGVLNLDFPVLRDVGGRFSVTNTEDLSTFRVTNEATAASSFPSLASVGALDVSNVLDLANLGSATDAEGEGALPRLATVSGNLNVASNGALASLALPRLATVGGTLTLSSNAQLDSFTLPTIIAVSGVTGAVDDVVISDNDQDCLSGGGPADRLSVQDLFCRLERGPEANRSLLRDRAGTTCSVTCP